MSKSYLELNSIKKKYDNQVVVDMGSLCLEKGEVIGLLGPNGAGKSTLIKILMGIIEADEGEIFFENKKKNSSEKFGYVPQEIALYDDLSIYDNLYFFGSLYNLKNPPLKERVDNIIKYISLSHKKNSAIKTLSGGMARRANIGAALVHNPDVIIMDEPTVGVDPQSRNEIYSLIEGLKTEGKTILYTTHYMTEVELLCDRVLIIDGGKLIEDGDINIVLKELGKGLLEIFADETHIPKIVELLGDSSGIGEVEATNTTINFVLLDEPQEVLARILLTLNKSSIPIAKFKIHPPNLETLFLKKTGKKIRE